MSLTFPDDSFTTTAYDAHGRKTAEIDATGRTTLSAYDGAGRLTMVTDALGQETVYTYNAAGNVLTHTDFNGDTTTYAYNPCLLRRLLLKTHADGSQVAYTGTGKRESITDGRINTRSEAIQIDTVG